ncbi:MAG: hypothetical protein JWM11_7304, partial [Planctomycetaceae bacterium]|nr:hypothetical protein [Planctomycetaceae bacterium]
QVDGADANDFGGTFPAGTVNFAVGQSTQTITVNVSGDSVVELDEGFLVTLTNPSAGVTLGTDTATETILNDDSTVSISPLNAIQSEGRSGVTGFTFTLTRVGATSGTASVNYDVTGSQVNGADANDFGGSLPSGTVNFAAGQMTQVITVNVTGDTISEPDEGFTVTLSNPSTGVTLGLSTADGTILNDDLLPVLSSTTVNENQPVGTVVGTLSAIGGSNLSFVLVSGTGSTDNAAFNIVGNQLQTAQVFDFETKSSYSIRLLVTDDQTLTGEEVFTILVTNVNEAPVNLNLTGNSVAENSSNGTAVGTFSTIDPDAGDTATYSLVTGAGSTNNGSFTIVGNQLKTTASFDFETQPSLSVRVRTTDQLGLSLDQVFQINVTNLNEPPQLIAGGAAGTFHGKAKTPVTILPNVGAVDPDTTAAFGVGGGQLVLTMNAVTAAKKKKGVTTFTTPDVIKLNGLSTIGTITSQPITSNHLEIHIQLLPSATASQIQSFLREVTFATSGTGLKRTSRAIQIQLQDAQGLAATLSQTVTVAKK